jgi:hypothetical protein
MKKDLRSASVLLILACLPCTFCLAQQPEPSKPAAPRRQAATPPAQTPAETTPKPETPPEQKPAIREPRRTKRKTKKSATT